MGKRGDGSTGASAKPRSWGEREELKNYTLWLEGVMVESGVGEVSEGQDIQGFDEKDWGLYPEEKWGALEGFSREATAGDLHFGKYMLVVGRRPDCRGLGWEWWDQGGGR